MKAKEEIIRMIEIGVQTEENIRRDYENGHLAYKDYLSIRRNLKHQLDSLLWVVGVKKCYYDYWTIEETFMRARQWLALLDNANVTPSC